MAIIYRNLRIRLIDKDMTKAICLMQPVSADTQSAN